MAHSVPDVRRTRAAGLDVAYREAGVGRSLVLLHGAYEDSRCWSAQLSGLSDEFHVLALDVPGFGESDDPPDTWDADELVDCIAELLATLGLTRPAVLGLSFGSVLALSLYARHPTSVGVLVLASAYAGWAGSLPPDEVERRVASAQRELVMGAEEFRTHFAATWLPTLLTPAAPPDLTQEIVRLATEFHPDGMRAALRTMGDVDLRQVLPRVAVPTLLLYGDADVRSPLTVARELQAQIPGAELVVLPGAPHLSNVEQPEAFNRAVREFLRTHPDVA